MIRKHKQTLVWLKPEKEVLTETARAEILGMVAKQMPAGTDASDIDERYGYRLHGADSLRKRLKRSDLCTLLFVQENEWKVILIRGNTLRELKGFLKEEARNNRENAWELCMRFVGRNPARASAA